MNVRLKLVDEGSDSPGRAGSGPLRLPPLEHQPLVSVLIANYNYARYVGAAINSALRQTYQRIELIVCDDGSTDGSRQVIEAHAASDLRVKTISKPNGGVASALNLAYAHASGSIICLLDADDLFLPEKVAAVVKQFREEPQTGLMLHAMMLVDYSGRELQQMPFLSKFETGWIAEQVIKRGGRYRYMPASALSIRREAADLVFPIPEERFRSLADGFIFTTLPLFTRVGAVPRILAQYKIHGANLTGEIRISKEGAKKSLADVGHVLDEVNHQLERLGHSDRRLDPNRNLSLIEQQLMLSLLNGGSPLALLREYLHYCSLLIRDDMFGNLQKLAYSSIYGIALLLPVSFRQSWLDRVFNPANKLQVQKAVEFIEGLFRVKPATEEPFKPRRRVTPLW